MPGKIKLFVCQGIYVHCKEIRPTPRPTLVILPIALGIQGQLLECKGGFSRAALQFQESMKYDRLRLRSDEQFQGLALELSGAPWNVH